jgi:hypothetical protein
MTRRLWLSTLATTFAAAAFLACGSDSHPPASGGVEAGPPPPRSDGSAPDDVALPNDGATPDAPGEDAAPPPICNQAALGAAVGETAVAGSPPTPVGGTIAPGTYRLSARNFYPDFGDPGAVPAKDLVKRTIVVAGTKMDLADSVSDADGGAVTTSTATSTFTINDLVLTRMDTCPAAGSVRNVSFSVVGDELWLFPATDKSEVYTKQ